MKQLTYSAMATARLRANKRQYLSLVLGIFLSVFLVSSFVLGVYGVYLDFLQDRYDKVGYLDMVFLDNDRIGQEDLEATGFYDQIGKAHLTGLVTDRNLYVGYYDNLGLELMNLEPKEGRLPETAGEIALERSALDILDVQWAIGETVELDITPIDGTVETRTFTVVGYLPERSMEFEIIDHEGYSQFPAIVTSVQEPGFSIGRVTTHYLMTLVPNTSIYTAIQYWWGVGNVAENVYGLSLIGEKVQFYGVSALIDANREVFELIVLLGVLTAALLLSCGVGISGAMEGVLSKRREEIGVLRALGATRRQIRRMFGRENLILALVLAPLSVGLSCLAVWVLSLFLPESLIFGFRLWLLAPIGAFSVVVILLSGYLPLVRASKLMPMSVIRDTVMLRRSKRVKMKKNFKPTHLIASRQVRFNPTRQIGAMLLVGLMLLTSGIFLGVVSNYATISISERPGFYIDRNWGGNSGYENIYEKPSLNQQSLQQLRGLDHVKKLVLDRNITMTAVLDEMTRYAIQDGWFDNFGMLNDEDFQEAMEYFLYESGFHEKKRESARKVYLQFLKDQNIDGEAYAMSLTTMDLENLAELKPYVESGKINVDAINAGREVIVVAPEIWAKPYGNGGYRYWHSEEAAKNDPAAEGAKKIAWNDSFAAGQILPLLHLYRTDPEGGLIREEVNATIGAVVSGDAYAGGMSTAYMITTEQGLENMGILVEGLSWVEIYLDGEITLQEEETLERQITAIARRNEGYTVDNQVARHRENAQSERQTILLFVALIILFFSVSVGMIVSAVTRQLNTEGRTIGMLRAVGADEKAILGCYSGSVTASVGGGAGISLGLVGIYVLLYGLALMNRGLTFSTYEGKLLSVMAVSICIMAVLCWFACRFFLRLRIREIVNKSIIDNIREL